MSQRRAQYTRKLDQSVLSSVRTNLNNTTILNSTLLRKNSEPNLVEENDCDIIYGQYLQALLKQQIVQQQISEQKEIVESQLKSKNNLLRKMERSLKEIQNNIDGMENKRKIFELLQFLERNLSDINEFCSKHDIFNVLTDLKVLLDGYCSRVLLSGNVKPIESDEDFNNLRDELENCNLAMEKMLKWRDDFDGVIELGQCIQTYKELVEKITILEDAILNQRKQVVNEFLQNASDAFAKLGEY